MTKIEDGIDDDIDDEDEIKVILVGEISTGKTSLINTAIGLEFKDKVESTHASSIITTIITIQNKQYNINIWDTIGQEKYRAVTKIFMKDAKIVILVYDITRLETFNQLDFWFESVQNVLGENAIIGIVGNKSDLSDQEEVTENIAQEYANKKGVPFSYTTAKDPKYFRDFLELLLKIYINKLENNDIKDEMDSQKYDEITTEKTFKKRKQKCC